MLSVLVPLATAMPVTVPSASGASEVLLQDWLVAPAEVPTVTMASIADLRAEGVIGWEAPLRPALYVVSDGSLRTPSSPHLATDDPAAQHRDIIPALFEEALNTLNHTKDFWQRRGERVTPRVLLAVQPDVPGTQFRRVVSTLAHAGYRSFGFVVAAPPQPTPTASEGSLARVWLSGDTLEWRTADGAEPFAEKPSLGCAWLMTSDTAPFAATADALDQLQASAVAMVFLGFHQQKGGYDGTSRSATVDIGFDTPLAAHLVSVPPWRTGETPTCAPVKPAANCLGELCVGVEGLIGAKGARLEPAEHRASSEVDGLPPEKPGPLGRRPAVTFLPEESGSSVMRTLIRAMGAAPEVGRCRTKATRPHELRVEVAVDDDGGVELTFEPDRPEDEAVGRCVVDALRQRLLLRENLRFALTWWVEPDGRP